MTTSADEISPATTRLIAGELPGRYTLTISQQAVDTLVLRVFDLVSSDTAPTMKSIRATIEAVLRPAHPEREGGWGRPELRSYIVARQYIQPKVDFDRSAALPREVQNNPHILGKHQGVVIEGWDNTDPAIMAARTRYNAGLVEMCLARDGDWQILYAIPRRRAVERHAPYFPARTCAAHSGLEDQ